MGANVQNNSGANASAIMQILSLFNKQPVTAQQQQAFQQGGGPVSQAGTKSYFQNGFNSQVWDNYGGSFWGQPSMNTALRSYGGGY